MGTRADAVTPAKTGKTEFVVLDEDGNNLWKIKSYSNGLCYNLFEWGEIKTKGTGETRWDWKDTGYYPSTLDHACVVIRDRMLNGSGIRTGEFADLKRAITRSTNLIIAAVERAFDERS